MATQVEIWSYGPDLPIYSVKYDILIPEEVLSSSTEESGVVVWEVDGSVTDNAGVYTCITNSESQKSVKVFIEGKW